MKRLIYVLSLLAVLMLTTIGVAALEGDGTAETPFLISTYDELLLLSDFPECCFMLKNDIEVNKEWKPVYEFSGVLDGGGFTISVVSFTKKSDIGLVGILTGEIKNLTIEARDVNIEYQGRMGLFAGTCSGVISNCVAKGNLTCTEYEDKNTLYVGGFCGSLSGKIENSIAKFDQLSVGRSYNDHGNHYVYCGGIAGESSGEIINCINNSTIKIFGTYYSNGYGRSYFYAQYGGITYSNKDGALISNCMNLEVFSDVLGDYSAFAGISYTNSGIIENCYSVMGTKYTTGYGISSGGTMTNCFYDSTVMGNSSTTYGTPKSTLAMKMKATYKEWDFDNIWGVDENINNGYPYLLWEYPNADNKVNPYKINEIIMKDLSGSVLEEIPEESFYVEVSVTKNDDSKDADSLVIAVYDENGVFMDLKYVSAVYYRNQTLTFGTSISKYDKKIGNIKCFVWESVFSMKPLSNSKSLK